MIIVLSYVSFSLHFSDQFLWFKARSVKETRDYQRIRALLMRQITKEILSKHLSETIIERIEGAAAKAVPNIREHRKIKIQLPDLYEVSGQQKSLMLEIELSDIRGNYTD